MDTRELTQALHDATDDVEPRPNFAADVLRGGRRRRTRNRFTIGAAVAGTAAVAVVAATVLPNHLASPPPADQREKHLSLLDSSTGELIDDEGVTRAAVLGWQDGIAGGAGERAEISPDDLLGEPHVYWAGTTPWGGEDFPATSTTVAIVAQEAALPSGATETVAGLVVNNPDDDRTDELELISVQRGGQANFMLPDLRTIICAVPADLPNDALALRFSMDITVDGNGKSVRDWYDMSELTYDGVAVAQLPADVNVHNVRLEYGTAERRASGFPQLVLPPNSGEIQDRGLPWPAESLEVPGPKDLEWEIPGLFQNGLADGIDLLDSYSGPSDYGSGHWIVAAHLPDGRTLILSEFQELDSPAWVFAVLVRENLTVETVTRVKEIDPASSEPVIAPAPDGQGWVVAAWGQQISYRTSAEGSWTDLGTSAALVPADGVEIKVTDTVYPLH